MQSLLAQLVQAMPGWGQGWPGWGQGGAHGCNFLIWRWKRIEIILYRWFEIIWDGFEGVQMAITWPMMASGLGIFDPSHRSLEWPGRSGIKIHPDDPFLDPGFIGFCPQRDTTWYPWWLDVLVNHSPEHVPPVYSSWAGRCSMPRPSIPWWNCKTRWRNCGRLSAWGTKVIDGIWGGSARK